MLTEQIRFRALARVGRGRARRRRRVALTAAVTAATLAVGACGSASGEDTVYLVGYSVPKPAYDALTAAFERTPAGRRVSFRASYGASGSQSKAVLAGQRADYVAFSVAPDLTRLVPKLVAAGWDRGPTHGLVSDSVVVLTVRRGNPLHITGWDDLVKPGVRVVTPDPDSSGSAKWNILAAYEHVISEGGTPAAAQAYLRELFAHVVSRASSGAVAMSQFLSGTGDVLVSYEDEAIDARQAGEPIGYVVPRQSMLIENPAAVTLGSPPGASAFLRFVESAAGQRTFASKGFRPVLRGVRVGRVEGANDPSRPFPAVTRLTTIEQLGGWSAVNEAFFSAHGLVTRIEGTG